MEKKYYYCSNSDNMIHNTDESNCRIKGGNPILIEILSSDDEVIDEVIGYETLGDLMESFNGGNDNE